MPAKRICVLANSIKKQHRCVAGRELIAKSGKTLWGDWIRPVTDHDEGAVTISECSFQDGSVPIPFDVVEVPLTSAEKNPTQPENWYIKKDSQWRKITSLSNKDVVNLIETPDDLWLEPEVKQDRVTPKFLLKQKNHQSLYLIRPTNFRFRVEKTSWDGVEKKRIRGAFDYKKETYDFSMTDPLISQKYFPDFSKARVGEKKLEKNSDLIICVSLTPEFNGYHYKIVATVMEI